MLLLLLPPPRTAICFGYLLTFCTLQCTSTVFTSSCRLPHAALHQKQEICSHMWWQKCSFFPITSKFTYTCICKWNLLTDIVAKQHSIDNKNNNNDEQKQRQLTKCQLQHKNSERWQWIKATHTHTHMNLYMHTCIHCTLVFGWQDNCACETCKKG